MIDALVLPLLLFATLALLVVVAASRRVARAERRSRRSDHATLQTFEAEIERLERGKLLDAAAIDLSGDAVLYLDLERRIMYVNKAGRALVTSEERRPLIELLRDHELDNLLRRSISQGETQRGMVRLSRPPRVVEATAHPVAGAGVVMVLRDRTEVMNLERVRRELVANVSHELRTPIATLQILVETLLNGASEDPDDRAYFLPKLHEEVDHLASIVRQSLQLAQMESGQSTLEVAPVEVRRLVREAAQRLASQAERAGVALLVEAPPRLPAVRADADQAERVLTNLLDNAIKWTPRGGKVTVGARAVDGWVRFEVTDTGPGVPPERLPRLFERFYTGDEARSGRSTGLGLAIAKHTVQLHGGRIWAESEEGKGARFYFTLPATPDSYRT